MAVPVISNLPPAPTRSDGPADFTPKADALAGALQPMVVQINIATQWMAGQLTETQALAAAAAASASAAANSATAANASKIAAAQQVTLAADQVALAAGQVALANAAKLDAQSAAVAAGAGAGLPVGREPFTALQINKAGAVGWAPGLPDRAAAQVGQSLMLDGDKLPKWAFAGDQIGDLLTTARNLPIDFSSVQATLPASVNWVAVTYGKGLFVAVAASSNIAATSPDGINWTQRAMPGAIANWYSITYANGLFVAVGNGATTIATSPDGINWTQRAAPVSANYRSVTYGNGLFVAVGQSSAIAITSPDGITWTQRVLPASINWYRISYGNGIFVATASSGSVCATSPDGVTWTGRILPASYNLRGIAFGNGLFVAVDSFSGTAITSPDGITWTVRALPASVAWTDITYGNGLFVTVASNSSIAATSPDGITWTQRALAVSTTWVAVAYGGGIYAAVASNSTIAATLVQGSGYLPANGTVYLQSAYPELFAKVGLLSNPAGSIWTYTANTDVALKTAIGTDGKGVWIRGNKRSNDNGATFPTNIVALGGGTITSVVNDGGNVWMAASAPNLYRSTDNGLTFTMQANVHPGATDGGQLVTDKAGTWISITYSNGFKVSKDNGLTWSQPATAPTGAQGVVFIGNNTWITANGYRSTDGGLTWALYGTPLGQGTIFSSMVYTNGVIIAIASASIRRSVDGGYSWITAATSNISTGGAGISTDGSGGVLVTGGATGIPPQYSADYGATWQNITLFAGITAVSFCAYGQGKFLMTGAQGYMSSVETFDYDKLTQFKTPSPVKIQGVTHYIKAKEVA